MREAGLPFQINTTVTRLNVGKLARMYDLVASLESACWDLFFLIPTGRARALETSEMPPEQYERTLNWLYDLQASSPLPVKQTCAPHFRRIERQRARAAGRDARPSMTMPASFASSNYSPRHGALSRGCMCGRGFCFVSHVGEVFGCGYLPLSAGNARDRSFGEIHANSPLFANLRDSVKLGGKCGACEYRELCGGCRARAFALSGDYLAEEPYCVYEPAR